MLGPVTRTVRPGPCKLPLTPRCILYTQHHRPYARSCRHRNGRTGCQAKKKDDDDDAPPTAINRLEVSIKRKQKEIESALMELGDEGIEERLKSAVENPAPQPFRLSKMIVSATETGITPLLVEVCRPSPDSTSQDLANLAKQYVQGGANALVVRTDSSDTPEGLKDLFTVCQTCKVPVLRRDWMIHPLQIAEAKEAGAAGVLGVINQVNGRGTPVMSSFAAAIGMDAPVEVVNVREVEFLASSGVVFYGINIQVGLSVAVPGFANQMADGLLGSMPFGAITVVGVRSLDDARRAKLSGADVLLVKKELIEAHSEWNPQELMQQLQFIASGDD